MLKLTKVKNINPDNMYPTHGLSLREKCPPGQGLEGSWDRLLLATRRSLSVAEVEAIIGDDDNCLTDQCFITLHFSP